MSEERAATRKWIPVALVAAVVVVAVGVLW